MTMTRVIPPEAEGTISTTPDGRAVLRFERHLRHSVDRVWAAVSQPAEMEAWLAFKARLEPEVGGINTCSPPGRVVVVTNGSAVLFVIEMIEKL